jgi:hypothetical protein
MSPTPQSKPTTPDTPARNLGDILAQTTAPQHSADTVAAGAPLPENAVPVTVHADTPEYFDALSQQDAPKPWIWRMVDHPRAPWVVGAILAAAVALVGVRVWAPSFSFGGTPRVVTFDPVKFANAQRAAASIMMVHPSADQSLTMTEVAKQAEPVIQEEAHGALVLVKQAVVVPQGIPDITDAVLTHFGLPTQVPTVTTDPGNNPPLEDIAPTDSDFGPGRKLEDYHIELQNQEANEALGQSKKDAQSKLVP